MTGQVSVFELFQENNPTKMTISVIYFETYNPNQNASSRHACHKFATSLRKLPAM